MVALCEGAAELGVDSEIVSFTAKLNPNEPTHPPFEKLYGVETPVRHSSYAFRGVSVDDEGKNAQIQRLLFYTFHFLRSIVGGKVRGYHRVVVSARNYTVLATLLYIKKILGRKKFVVLADVHGMPGSRFARWVHTKVDGNVCISHSLAADLCARLGISEDRVCVAHTGVKIERFDRLDRSKQSLRAGLGLPQDKTIICYTGKVYYRYEEIAYLIEAAQGLDDSVLMLIVGGRPDQVQMWEAECQRENRAHVAFRAFVPPADIPLYLRAADLLVMYYSPSPLNDYRSPGKLFEYLASGTPVVTGRSRSIEEVVRDGQNGFLVEPYDAALLQEKILDLLDSKDDLQQVGECARQTVPEYTWRKRAEKFLSFAERISQRDR